MDRVADPDRSGPIGRRGLDVEALVAPAPRREAGEARSVRLEGHSGEARASAASATISSASRSGWSRETNVRAPRNSTSVASGNVAEQPLRERVLEERVARRPAEQHRPARTSRASAGESASSSRRQARANVATSRRTPASVRYGVTQRRLSSGARSRRTSPPKPSLLCRRNVDRIGCSTARAGPGCRAEPEQHVERERREGVERVAVGQHQPADPARVLVEQQLADRSPGVAADQHHVVEVQRLEEARHDPRHAARRQVGAVVHRGGVRAERPGRRVRVEARARPAAPARRTTACRRRGSRARTPPADRPRARLAVVDRPGGQVDAPSLHLPILPRVGPGVVLPRSDLRDPDLGLRP